MIRCEMKGVVTIYKQLKYNLSKKKSLTAESVMVTENSAVLCCALLYPHPIEDVGVSAYFRVTFPSIRWRFS